MPVRAVLDIGEVGDFFTQLALSFDEDETKQAIVQMGADADGNVDFEGFLAWYARSFS